MLARARDVICQGQVLTRYKHAEMRVNPSGIHPNLLDMWMRCMMPTMYNPQVIPILQQRRLNHTAIRKARNLMLKTLLGKLLVAERVVYPPGSKIQRSLKSAATAHTDTALSPPLQSALLHPHTAISSALAANQLPQLVQTSEPPPPRVVHCKLPPLKDIS